MREEWRPLEGWEGLYEVSNRGDVKSVERTAWNKGKGCYRTVHERILKAHPDKYGYLYVVLSKDGKGKKCKIHRLVAQAFLPNTSNLPDVNHKDENKQNNYVENLEWCSRAYNNTYNGRAKKVGKKNSKPVIGIDKISGLIVEFSSISEAGRILGIDSSHICDCCKGRLKSIGNFYWYYADTEE